MPVSFVSAATGTVAEGTSATASAPSGARSGDLVIPTLYIDEPDPIVVPRTWTPAASPWNAGATFGEHVWAVPFDGFGTGVMSWTTRTWHDWLALAFRGADLAAPINAIGSATGSGRTATAPSIRTTVDGCQLVLVAISNGDATATPPANMIEVSDAGDGHYAAVATAPQPTAGDTGSVAATFSASFPWIAILLAVAPAPNRIVTVI